MSSEIRKSESVCIFVPEHPRPTDSAACVICPNNANNTYRFLDLLDSNSHIQCRKLSEAYTQALEKELAQLRANCH